MSRWLGIQIRRCFGKYTHDRAAEWEDWTPQWKAYYNGDPISQMVRGTWEPKRTMPHGTWEAGALHGTWEQERDDA